MKETMNKYKKFIDRFDIKYSPFFYLIGILTSILGSLVFNIFNKNIDVLIIFYIQLMLIIILFLLIIVFLKKFKLNKLFLIVALISVSIGLFLTIRFTFINNRLLFPIFQNKFKDNEIGIIIYRFNTPLKSVEKETIDISLFIEMAIAKEINLYNNFENVKVKYSSKYFDPLKVNDVINFGKKSNSSIIIGGKTFGWDSLTSVSYIILNDQISKILLTDNIISPQIHTRDIHSIDNIILKNIRTILDLYNINNNIENLKFDNLKNDIMNINNILTNTGQISIKNNLMGIYYLNWYNHFKKDSLLNESQNYFTMAIEDNPKNHYAFYCLGYIKSIKNYINEAMIYYERAYLINDSNFKYLYNYIQSLIELNKFDDIDILYKNIKSKDKFTKYQLIEINNLIKSKKIK